MEINKHWYIAPGQACQIYKTCTRCRQVKRRAHDFYSCGKGSKGKGAGKRNGLVTKTRCKQCDNKVKWLTRKMKKRLIERQGQMCFYCWEEVDYNRLGIDHVVPIAKGGTDDEDNLVLCCNNCNMEKGTMSYEEFIETNPQRKPQKITY